MDDVKNDRDYVGRICSVGIPMLDHPAYFRIELIFGLLHFSRMKLFQFLIVLRSTAVQLCFCQTGSSQNRKEGVPDLSRCYHNLILKIAFRLNGPKRGFILIAEGCLEKGVSRPG